MDNRKRHKNRKITPSADDDDDDYSDRLGTENPTFLNFQNDENGNHETQTADISQTGSKELKSVKILHKAVTQGSEKNLNPINIISNMRLRVNMEQWKSYACTRRVKKRKTKFEDLFVKALEHENVEQLHSGLDVDDKINHLSNLTKSHQEILKKNSQVSVPSNQALIQYFARLGQSKNSDERIDLEFVQALLASGASINCADRHGQTIMHEVAKAWHVDVAKFLIGHGADINKGDNFGRTPLHVAAAVDYVEMIKILIENGAEKEAKTIEENQTPVFYAAKTDAVQALKALIINHGCLFKDIVDYRGRTPIHVAAELDRSETARLLLEYEAPVFLSDDHGSKAITWMISKMAPVANEALNQLYSTDRANRKQYFALNHLVCDKEKDPTGKIQTPLHTAVGFKQYDLLMHPVFRHLLDTMWHQFGRFWTLYQLGLNFVYILMWTVIGILIEYDDMHIYNLPDDAWRIVLYLIAVAFTLYQITDEVMEFRRSEKVHSYHEDIRKADIEKDMKFCHPRWPEEKKYLEMEIEILENIKPKYFHDMWNIFDWICYIMLIICIATHIADIIDHSEALARLHIRFMTVTVILLWLRLMKNARAFSILGPFIVMLGHMLKDCVRFLFLYLEFYIPYLAAFWMTFGGTKKLQNSENKDISNETEEISVSGFEYPGQIFFSLFRLTLVDDYDYDNMLRIDSIMADILLTTWFLLSAILSLNLFIALLSDTFQRVYDNAQANAVMQRAIIILNIWEGINSRRKEKFLMYIENNCSPLREEYDDDLTEPAEDELKKVTVQIKEEVDNLKEMFKLQFGDPTLELYRIESNQSEDGNINQNGNNSHNVVQSLRAELNDLREVMKSSRTQQENTAAVIHNDMIAIKQMLSQLLEKKSAEVARTSDAVLVSDQIPLSKMKKKKRKPVNVGLEIDLIDNGSRESATHDAWPLHRTSEVSPELFQDTTQSTQSHVFDVMLSPPSTVKRIQQEPGTNDESSTNC